MKGTIRIREETGRLQGTALAAVWLLLAVIPGLFLRFTISTWLEQQEEMLFQQTQRQAATEMRDFQNDLEIPRALDLSLRKIPAEFGFTPTPASQTAEAIERFSQFSDSDFQRLRRSITREAGSNPSLLLMVDHTRCRTWIWSAPERHLGSSPEESEKILRQILTPLILQPLILPNTNRDVFADMRALSERFFGIGKHPLSFSSHSEAFNPLFGGPGLAYGISFGCSLTGERQRQTRRAASLFIFFHSRDINHEQLAQTILQVRGHRGFRRRIESARSQLLPRIFRARDNLLLIDAPPTTFPRKVLEGFVPRESLSNRGNLVLMIKASNKTWSHPFRRWLPFIDIGIFLVIATATFGCCRLYLQGFPSWAGLTGKIIIGFALGALVPLCGLSLVTTAWLLSQEASRPASITTHMQQRLERLEKCFGIIDRHWAHRILPYTKALSRHLESPDVTNALLIRAVASEGGNIGRSIMIFPAGKQDASMFSDCETQTHQQLFPIAGAYIFDLMRELQLRKEEEANSMVTGNFINLAQSIAEQYVDSSFARFLAARAGLLQPNLFGNIHEHQSVQFLPPLDQGQPRRGMALVLSSNISGHIPFLKGFTEKLTKTGEIFRGYALRYSFFELDTFEPPIIGRTAYCDNPKFRRQGFTLAERTLRERGNRAEAGVTKYGVFLAVSRWLNQGAFIGVARAEPLPKSIGHSFRFPMLLFGSLLGLWFGVTLSASFLLTRPIPSFLEATRQTAAGHFDWRLSLPTTDEFGDLAGVFNAMANGLSERAKMSRFVSDEVLETVQRDDQTLLRPLWEQARVAILFSDIRSFTTLSETHHPEAIVAMLNDYFTAMEFPIREHGGSINSLIGDAILAVFSPKPGTDAPEIRACLAAKGMRQALTIFNTEREAAGLFTIATGIGIATGDAVYGNIGSETGRLSHAVLGETADRAPRLEALSRKTTGSGIIIDQETRVGNGQRLKAKAIPSALLPAESLLNQAWEITLRG